MQVASVIKLSTCSWLPPQHRMQLLSANPGSTIQVASALSAAELLEVTAAIAARRPALDKAAAAGGPAKVKPRLGRNRTLPPA